MSSTAESRGSVGLIGLGLMGTAMAARLRQAGFAIYGHDVHPQRRAEFAAAGGTAVEKVADMLAAQSENASWTLLLSLPDSAAVESVLAELQPPPGTLILDTTTGDPDRTAAIANDLAARGVRYCDATIVGSSEQVRRGEVVALVGGVPEDAERCREILTTFCQQIFFTGPAGSGAKMKLVVNLVLGLNRAALAEGLAFAESYGIAPADALQVLRAGVSYSAVMDTKGEKMVTGNFAPQARLSQHLKDVRIILDVAGQCGISLPLSNAHAQLLQCAEDRGLGLLDNSAILKVYEDDRRERPA
jgi:3-hydroxyisobutyrate dehydrogenase-like beta-hydroxyacid dehydrogenase